MKKTLTVGVDLGGTNTEIGLVRNDGHIVARETLSTQAYTDFHTFVGDMLQVITRLTAEGDPETGWKGTHADLKGIGIGAPNADHERKCMANPINLPRFPGISYFEKEFRALGVTVPVEVDNDANCAALGELVFGAAKGLKHFVMVTLGTGVGSGIVVDGKLLYGTGAAGELGHSILVLDGRECNCGRKGCLETYASAGGIVQTYIELGGNITNPNSKAIGIAAKHGDPIALETFEKVGYWLGIACANLVSITAPEAIFLMGGPTLVGEPLLKPLRESFERNLLFVYRGKCHIGMSQLDTNDAAILGAAALLEV